jgi:tRNA dimethylallyltransferase
LTKKLLVLAGPTGVGKTGTAIKLARHLGSPIVNCDSRQLYREISIGTAKPDDSELEQAEHHLINTLSIHRAYTAADFEKDALEKLEELYRKTELVILCGGSGLFIKAVCEGLDVKSPANTALREELQRELEQEGIGSLVSRLKKIAPEKADKTDLKNPRRIIRAIEIALSPAGEAIKKERFFHSIPVLLTLPREELYRRINERVDVMVKKGLPDEARSVFQYRHLNALQTVGYKEMFEYLDGKADLETAISKIKQHSRNYAKRQMTWFRNQGNFTAVENTEQAIGQIIALIRKS